MMISTKPKTRFQLMFNLGYPNQPFWSNPSDAKTCPDNTAKDSTKAPIFGARKRVPATYTARAPTAAKMVTNAMN